jgi:biotin carboxyl carrier protein
VKYTVIVDGEVFEIEISRGEHAWVNQEPYLVDMRHVGARGEYSLLVDNRSYDIHVADRDNGHRCVTVGGRSYRTRLQRSQFFQGNGHSGAAESDPGVEKSLVSQVEMRAPLPGLLVELRARKGEHVGEQEVVAVLESMKMNLELRAPRGGLVHDLLAVPGQQVAQDEVLVVIRPNGASRSETRD